MLFKYLNIQRRQCRIRVFYLLEVAEEVVNYVLVFFWTDKFCQETTDNLKGILFIEQLLTGRVKYALTSLQNFLQTYFDIGGIVRKGHFNRWPLNKLLAVVRVRVHQHGQIGYENNNFI